MGTVTRLPKARLAPVDVDPSLTLTFDIGDANFGSLEAARDYLARRGFSFGPLQGGSPIGILLGEAVIGKWSRLSPEDRADLHGVMTAVAGDYRRGAVTIAIRPDAPSAVIEAFRSTPDSVVQFPVVPRLNHPAPDGGTSDIVGADLADDHPVIDIPIVFGDGGHRYVRLSEGADRDAQAAVERSSFK